MVLISPYIFHSVNYIDRTLPYDSRNEQETLEERLARLSKYKTRKQRRKTFVGDDDLREK
jgi:hypothetical protein